MEFTIKTLSVPAGFFSYLLVKGVDDRKVHNCHTSSLKQGWCTLASCPRAKFSTSEGGVDRPPPEDHREGGHETGETR